MCADNITPAKPKVTTHLTVLNMVIASLAGIISITGGLYSIKSNFFPAEKAFGEIAGTVRDERLAKPLRMATIEITDSGNLVIGTLSTDDNGRFSQKGIKEGNYQVKGEAIFHISQVKTVSVEKKRTTTIDFNLVPVETKEAIVENTPPSAVIAQRVPANASFPAAAAGGAVPNAVPYAGSNPVPAGSMNANSYGGAVANPAGPSYSQAASTQPAYTARGTRHPRRSAYPNSADSLFPASQSPASYGSQYPVSTTATGSGQGQSMNALVQVGTQLFGQMLANQNKKTTADSAEVTSVDSSKTN